MANIAIDVTRRRVIFGRRSLPLPQKTKFFKILIKDVQKIEHLLFFCLICNTFVTPRVLQSFYLSYFILYII